VKATYEFNIRNLSLASNTVIKTARFNAIINTLRRSPFDDEPIFVALFGYAGNGRPEASDFEAGELLVYKDLPVNYRGDSIGISWDIAPFISELLSNSVSFAGFSITGYGERFSVEGVFTDSPYPEHPYTNWYPTLEITTEPVPEPATIFGSAIGLCLGGWLKRKKSTSQNKATSQG
jgi:hypothetical protein